MRTLHKWSENRERIGEYRRLASGKYVKRAKILVDGIGYRFRGTGGTPEQADAALRSFLSPDCVCGPLDCPGPCPVHQRFMVVSSEAEEPCLEAGFVAFPPNYTRWPSTGVKEDGEIDYEVVNAHGFSS